MPQPKPVAPECKRCRAIIRFVELKSGNFMPCNPIPDNTGNVAARKIDLGNDRVRYVDGFVIKNGHLVPPGFTRFRPHWADCNPNTAKPARVHVPTLF